MTTKVIGQLLWFCYVLFTRISIEACPDIIAFAKQMAILSDMFTQFTV